MIFVLVAFLDGKKRQPAQKMSENQIIVVVRTPNHHRAQYLASLGRK